MSTIRSRFHLAITIGLGIFLLAGISLPPTLALAKVHEVSMTAMETDIVIDGSGEKYAAWTFNGTVPGPVVRVTEGDTTSIRMQWTFTQRKSTF
jgi:nitrite reductase (NO-forming)